MITPSPRFITDAEWQQAWREALASGIDFLPAGELASEPDDDDLTAIEIGDEAWDIVADELKPFANRSP